ncbi:ATP-dependent exonuclease [Salegentibacter salinarum]|uniref:ATP-dependent exonuclease n=1 Tax=Salegentibacter salinarum TaxID=447422 RepID=A0A2N0U3I0_9FLAO|nr:DUF3108 domain-containing protein [Salegentibacter salinarum]PKD21438.1 ATP-dependent exonuclease [Salegentibacter salinarum]SKB38716.1 Protein of unknown function [Salegentibacter salinarum]
MKKSIFTIFLLLLTGVALQAQSQKAFSAGEWFKFRIHYGPFNASFATLEVDETSINGKPVYHVEGKGKSTGLLHWFFKVDDNYQTYIDKQDGKPYKFIRKIDEGGYTKDLEIDFDHSDNKAYVFDRKHNENHTYTTKPKVHDMLSAFYYIRNNINTDELQPGDDMNLNLFIDDENMDFKLKFLGREVIKTKFGKVATLKFRPYVMAGRVFKEKESLTFWVSDDANKLPIKIEANLAVGSLDADLDEYKGLKHPFKIIME